MFNLGRLANLSRLLCVEESIIRETLDDFDNNPDAVVSELTLWPADRNKKPRDVISIRGKWRLLQRRLYTTLFLPRMVPLPFSHGGVKRRSFITNARAHIGNTYAFVSDISSFYPSISCYRLNKFFLRQACSYDVARILTRLCTYDYHLALGLITSPILANEIFRPVDLEIFRVCNKMGLKYTRFVDDITISGKKHELDSSGIKNVIKNILNRHNFKMAENKTKIGRLDEDITITGVRLKTHHLDAPKSYIQEVERLITDHISLSIGGEFTGPLLTESEIFGKCHYVCALNPGRRRSILGKLKSINWGEVTSNAVDRELMIRRNRLIPRGDMRPDCSEELPQRIGKKHYQEYIKSTPIDPTVAPF